MACDRAIESNIDNSALECEQLNAIHPALLQIARRLLRHEAFDYLWSPSCLVNDAYIRIAAHYGKAWIHHSNVLALWHRAMRHVLIDSARAYRSHKRSIDLTVALGNTVFPGRPIDVERGLALTRALQRMSVCGPRQALVVRLRFVEGLSLEETADTLRISTRTAKRALKDARTTIRAELSSRPLRA